MGTSKQPPGAGGWVPDRPSLASLRAGVQDCKGCELYREATQGVPGTGPRDAPIMVIGEQPGDREDREGMPFVGPAGQLLDKALDEAGIDPAEVFRTNVVKHFRFTAARGKQRIHKSPSRVHVAACGPWLVAEMGLVRPAGVVLLGGTAGKAVYGASFRVGEARGQIRDWPPETAGARPAGHVPDWVVATTHPSAVLRSKAARRRFRPAGRRPEDGSGGAGRVRSMTRWPLGTAWIHWSIRRITRATRLLPLLRGVPTPAARRAGEGGGAGRLRGPVDQ